MTAPNTATTAEDAARAIRPIFRRRYDQAENETIGDAGAIDFRNEPGVTIQEPKQDADINILMKRMGVKDGSVLPRFAAPDALWGDYSLMSDDPVEVANAIREGELAFMRLPALVRRRFESAEELFKFLNSDDNYEEAVRLGLLEKKTPKVSSSTSSDKEPLVPPSNSKENQ